MKLSMGVAAVGLLYVGLAIASEPISTLPIPSAALDATRARFGNAFDVRSERLIPVSGQLFAASHSILFDRDGWNLAWLAVTRLQAPVEGSEREVAARTLTSGGMIEAELGPRIAARLDLGMLLFASSALRHTLQQGAPYGPPDLGPTADVGYWTVNASFGLSHRLLGVIGTLEWHWLSRVKDAPFERLDTNMPTPLLDVVWHAHPHFRPFGRIRFGENSSQAWSIGVALTLDMPTTDR